MTDEEIRQMLAARLELTLPSVGAPTRDELLRRVGAAGDRVAGAAGTVAPGLVGALPGPIGTLARAASATPQTVRERAAQVATGSVPEDAPRAPGQLPPEEPGPLREMNTPLADVAPAPQLDTRLATVGRPMAAGAQRPGQIGSLRDRLLAAQQRQVGILGEQAAIAGDLSAARVGRTLAVADVEEQEAARQQREAEEFRAAEKKAAADTKAVLEHQQKMIDDLAKARPDPKRLFRQMGTGEQIAMFIGAALSGFVSGVRGGPNEFLQRLDAMVDRDINAQLEEISNKRAAISSRQGLVNQMIQLTGDRRTGAMAARNMILEALKLDIQAKTERLGVPEMRAQGEMMVNAIEQEQQQLATGFVQQQYANALASARAAAAARAAAEQKAWERSMKLMELGQKQDELNIKRLEAEGKTAKDVDARVEKLGQSLADPKLQQGRAVVDALAAELEKTPQGKQLKGLDWQARSVAALPFGEHILSDEANINRQNWEDFMGVLRQMRTGAGGSEKEMENIRREAEGARTAAEKANVIRKAQRFFIAQEEALRAAAGPEASRRFDSNRQAIKGQMPASVEVKK